MKRSTITIDEEVEAEMDRQVNPLARPLLDLGQAIVEGIGITKDELRDKIRKEIINQRREDGLLRSKICFNNPAGCMVVDGYGICYTYCGPRLGSTDWCYTGRNKKRPEYESELTIAQTLFTRKKRSQEKQKFSSTICFSGRPENKIPSVEERSNLTNNETAPEKKIPSLESKSNSTNNETSAENKIPSLESNSNSTNNEKSSENKIPSLESTKAPFPENIIPSVEPTKVPFPARERFPNLGPRPIFHTIEEYPDYLRNFIPCRKASDCDPCRPCESGCFYEDI